MIRGWTVPVTSVLVCAKAIAVGKQVAIEHPNKKIQNVENNGLVEKNKPMLLSDRPIRFAHSIHLGWIYRLPNVLKTRMAQKPNQKRNVSKLAKSRVGFSFSIQYDENASVWFSILIAKYCTENVYVYWAAVISFRNFTNRPYLDNVTFATI